MNEAEMTIPYLFRCPISLDLFKDPVTLCTGQTYDRSSIEKWMSTGNLTCPVTMQKLHDPTIVPNHTLKHLIDQWLQIGDQFDSKYLEKFDSLAALKHNLESHEVTLENKLQTLKKIQALSEESSSRNSCLLQLGFFPLLLEQVFGRVAAEFSEEHMKFLEQALVCVQKLVCLSEIESLNMLKQETKLASFLLLFKHGSQIIKMSLCHVIETSSTSLETEQLCSIFGKNSELIYELLQFVKQNSEISEAGIKALWALCSLKSNRELLVREGVIDGLLTYIVDTERRERSLAPLAMATIEKLLAIESSKEALVNNPNGIDALVKMAFRISDHKGSESAIGSLMRVCYGSLQARDEAIAAGVLTQILLLLQSQCTAKIKTKARMLLKLLTSKKINEGSIHV